MSVVFGLGVQEEGQVGQGPAVPRDRAEMRELKPGKWPVRRFSQLTLDGECDATGVAGGQPNPSRVSTHCAKWLVRALSPEQLPGPPGLESRRGHGADGLGLLLSLATAGLLPTVLPSYYLQADGDPRCRRTGGEALIPAQARWCVTPGPPAGSLMRPRAEAGSEANKRTPVACGLPESVPIGISSLVRRKLNIPGLRADLHRLSEAQPGRETSPGRGRGPRTSPHCPSGESAAHLTVTTLGDTL